jgi:serine/threonine-protein kinase HipA
MDTEVLVHVDLDGVPHLAGRLWVRLRKNKETASFEYDPAWLQHPARFSLEPALVLGEGVFHPPATSPRHPNSCPAPHSHRRGRQ